ncbi:hypothetical protein [Streptomyces noursei]|uniref:hypothetical protein n=1 Tax=Streptomyces noursei TaxID=1971 RepID=UPI0011AEE1C1|nr:hypothetical protein [Streptomyces noursei]
MGRKPVEVAEGDDAGFPLQLREQRRGGDTAGEISGGASHTYLRATHTRTSIAELQNIGTRAHAAAETLGFALQPVHGLVSSVAPLFELACHFGGPYRNGKRKKVSKLINCIQWVRLMHKDASTLVPWNLIWDAAAVIHRVELISLGAAGVLVV